MTGALALGADNQAAIAMGAGNTESTRTKHIDVHYHFVRSCVLRGYLRLVYTRTDSNPADMFTKPLGEAKLVKFRKSIGLA